MAFQFLCPQGHMLQGEPTQAGQQCKCPYCQTEFLVPAPAVSPQAAALPGTVPQIGMPSAAAPQAAVPPAAAPPAAALPAALPPDAPAAPLYAAPKYEMPVAPAPAAPGIEGAAEGAFPGIRTGADFGDRVSEDSVPQDVAAQFGTVHAEQQSVLHIPCPKGHVLETPRDMLGQDAMCPFCQRQFRLDFHNSREYRAEKEDRRERREQKLGQAWMRWSIAAAVVVVLGVILSIAVVVTR